MSLLGLFIILMVVLGSIVALTSFINNTIISIIFAIALSGVLSVIIYKLYNKTLNGIKYYINCINKNDLMVDTNKERRGLSREIIQEIEVMLQGLRENFKQQVDISTKITDISEKINTVTTETQTAIESIATSTEITSQKSEDQFHMMTDVNKKAETIVDVLNNIDKEMNATVQFTSESINSAQEGIKATGGIEEKIRITRELVKENEKKVNDLMVYSEEVVKLIDLINSISQQTNMLSLNASIEAARAGEHGKGFAVVASEVSKLAKETGEVSSKIEDVISTLKNDISDISKAMKQETAQVEESYDVIRKSMNDFSNIDESLRTSLEKIKGINSCINNANDSGNEIQASIDEVTTFANEISSQMQETTAHVIVQSEKITSLQNIIKELNETADDMQQYVTSKVMGGKMLRDVEYIQNEIKNKTVDEMLLNRLLKETGVDVIYITNKNGDVIHCNEKNCLGINLYEIDSSFLSLKNRQVPYVTTPVKKRIEDGKLFKFLAKIDDDGYIYQVGLSIESLMKF